MSPMPEHQQIQQSKKTNNIFQKQATPVIQTPLSNPYSIIQRAKINPKSLTHADVMRLQRTIGNRAVAQLLSGIVNSSIAQQATVQRQEISEEEEPLQGKMIETVQRQEIPEEEETLQGKMIGTIQRQEISEEEEPLQGKFEDKPEIACPSCFAVPLVQRQEIPEEEEPLQGKMIGTIQRQEIPEEDPLQTKRENNTGMPDNLKAGVESLSRIDMNDVRVHYNSSKPAEVGALAYTQGTNIHVSPGQEGHLPHEAWYVVQQAQGRVKPTMQLKDRIPINDDEGLEHEADIMGEKALQHVGKRGEVQTPRHYTVSGIDSHAIQHAGHRPDPNSQLRYLGQIWTVTASALGNSQITIWRRPNNTVHLQWATANYTIIRQNTPQDHDLRENDPGAGIDAYANLSSFKLNDKVRQKFRDAKDRALTMIKNLAVQSVNQQSIQSLNALTLDDFHVTRRGPTLLGAGKSTEAAEWECIWIEGNQGNSGKPKKNLDIRY